jgi:antitoxin CptB
MTDDIRLKRLSYRAHHRGFKEADLLLGAFADAHLAVMAPDQLAAFESLLEEQDQDIYDWYLGKAEPPAQHRTSLFNLLKSFDFFPRAEWR